MNLLASGSGTLLSLLSNILVLMFATNAAPVDCVTLALDACRATSSAFCLEYDTTSFMNKSIQRTLVRCIALLCSIHPPSVSNWVLSDAPSWLAQLAADIDDDTAIASFTVLSSLVPDASTRLLLSNFAVRVSGVSITFVDFLLYAAFDPRASALKLRVVLQVNLPLKFR